MALSRGAVAEVSFVVAAGCDLAVMVWSIKGEGIAAVKKARMSGQSGKTAVSSSDLSGRRRSDESLLLLSK